MDYYTGSQYEAILQAHRARDRRVQVKLNALAQAVDGAFCTKKQLHALIDAIRKEML